jgi:hypothetical protein
MRFFLTLLLITNVIKDFDMTPKKFYDWQTAGGTDEVMRLVDCL